MEGLYDKIIASASYLRTRIGDQEPRIGIILGTGLSNLGDKLTDVTIIPYRSIPHFPVSTVESHQGNLLFGKLNQVPVIIMQGRFHYYEGYAMSEVTYPIRIMHNLGIQHIMLSNAAGGLRSDLHSGDIVVIEDHINYQPENPLRGAHDERLGVRFPDMTHAYDPGMILTIQKIAAEYNIPLKKGIYLGLQGPNLETQAELRFFRSIGADLVGMSTVPEVIVARQCNLNVLGLSVVTNECLPEHGEVQKTTIESVVQMANRTEPKLTILVKKWVENIHENYNTQEA